MLRNIKNLLLNKDIGNDVTASTGRAAALIYEKTHYRSLEIPTSLKVFYSVTNNIKIINTDIGKD